ncbi:NAD(P)H-dependent glycerol-3-phosphate dehydrogenase [Rubricoccus marinus]|uniref:Glycerol-3-phosphate dehydrogenase [NAD(P)+] n=1 Tax=Rubricoccus marinus TaxID=716817 RepID=A0A259U031_9BACT|nr:NAD(P)H-dependent glycerol-3-phosphate dehydrogenase [Rubricoccus marinus]OZC03385.1 glycerol-3-phosphate dehydrogenase [Rubricoccus marinus]
MDIETAHTAVFGAGSWGTALAYSLAKAGHPVTLWARREDAAREIAATRRNAAYLPNAELPASLRVTSDLHEAASGASVWLFAVPSQSLRSVATQLADRATEPEAIVSVAKGIENGTLLTTSGVLREALPLAPEARVGVLYGPSHAEEVALGQPTSVVVSIPDLAIAEQVQALFMTPSLRVYTNTDLVGVEIAGSVKNVMALAAGMGDGMGLGDNAKAALVTRGLAEITSLGLAMGAAAHTFAGLAGLGDLVVTCFSKHSRNRGFGEMIGGGKSLEEAADAMTMVVEGMKTTASVRELASRYGIEMPITEAVARVIDGESAPYDEVCSLMTRDPKHEAAHLDGSAFA